MAMEMDEIDIGLLRRVRTRITYGIGKRQEVIEDRHIIYPDPSNKGRLYVAVSQGTGTIGVGLSDKEAYVDLITGMVRALKHGAIGKNIKSEPANSVRFDEDYSRINPTDSSVQDSWIVDAFDKLVENGEFSGLPANPSLTFRLLKRNKAIRLERLAA